MAFDPQKHPFDDAEGRHRRSIRLQGYDYSKPGGYYITIVTQGRELLFGEVMNGEMKLSAYGRIADECWREIPKHFPHAELVIYVVMPNHIHGIIILHDTGRGAIYRAPTEQFGKPVPGSVPTIVRSYKAAVTRRVGRELNGGVVWQRNYYEHIIRNDEDTNRIYDYIESNPAEWENDEENPARKPKD